MRELVVIIEFVIGVLVKVFQDVIGKIVVQIVQVLETLINRVQQIRLVRIYPPAIRRRTLGFVTRRRFDRTQFWRGPPSERGGR
ncbi:MAG: hypothetical protein AAFX08_06385 [Pseudomonadota bacterium]